MTVADPGFTRGECANRQGVAPTYNFAKCFQKLYEIERTWTPGGARPSPPLDPPLHYLEHCCENNRLNTFLSWCLDPRWLKLVDIRHHKKLCLTHSEQIWSKLSTSDAKLKIPLWFICCKISGNWRVFQSSANWTKHVKSIENNRQSETGHSSIPFWQLWDAQTFVDRQQWTS